MRLLPSLLLAAAAAPAAAQPNPGPRPTVTAVTTFERCTKITMHACMMRDANGHIYGTAQERNHCEQVVLRPDGTFSATFDTDPGTYRIFAGKVHFTTHFSDGRRIESLILPLSPDGQRLGELTRKR